MNTPKFIIAPDSFKESLTSLAAAEAMKAGIEKVFASAEIELIPMADGGEGTLEVIINARKGEFRKVTVTDPLGRKIEAQYGFISEDKKAVIEIAKACGLQLINKGARNPLNTTTYGVGQIIIDALDNGAKHLIICLGGSATNDGGLGMLMALGAKAYNKFGEKIGLGGKELINIDYIDVSSLDSRLKDINIEVACDVENPLVGKNGATFVFAPQKGADEKIIEVLEEGMLNYSRIIKECLKVDVGNMPKAGAAGGLGAAFILLGANMVSGVDLVLKHTNFEEKVQGAAYIFTGEGSVDYQTKYGKTIAGIGQIGKKYNIPVIVLAGKVGDNIDELYSMGITAVFGIIDKPKELDEALKDGFKSIEKVSENIARILKIIPLCKA